MEVTGNGARREMPEEALTQAETWLDEGRLSETVALLEDWAARLDHRGPATYFDRGADATRLRAVLEKVLMLRRRLEAAQDAAQAELDGLRAQAKFERAQEPEPPTWVLDRA